jgi:hypothetical protein
LALSVNLQHSFEPLVIEGSFCWFGRCSVAATIIVIQLGLISATLVIMATLSAQLLGKLEISFQDIAEADQNLRLVP